MATWEYSSLKTLVFVFQKIGQTSSGETYPLEEYVYVERNMILGCFAPCLSLVFKIKKLVDFIFSDNATRPCKVATARIVCEVLP